MTPDVVAAVCFLIAVGLWAFCIMPLTVDRQNDRNRQD